MAPTAKIKIVYDSLLCFCKPVIGPWALQENNVLQFSDNKPIRARGLSPTNTSHRIKNNKKDQVCRTVKLICGIAGGGGLRE